MGNCGGSAENLSPEESAKRKQDIAKTKAFDAVLDKEHEDAKQINKLLLLGAGESGKSTLFKQMIKLYGVGFSDQDRKNTYVKVVHTNVIICMKALCGQTQQHADPPVSDKLMDFKRKIDDLKGDEDLTPALAQGIAALWEDPGVQSTYEKRNVFQLNDSCKYLLSRVADLAKEDYVPTDLDILSVRVRTTGIVQNEFKIDGNMFQIYDVGGQRNERKKWIHCFENVTAVIFVVAINEYDQQLYEDETVNRMTEALTLFDEICNSRWFKKTSMIVFFNKADLFKEKLEKKSISVCFADYKGSQDFEESSKYIIQLFLSRNRQKDITKFDGSPKKIYTHVTCATDSTAMRVVFNSVKDIIIRVSLEAAGLV